MYDKERMGDELKLKQNPDIPKSKESKFRQMKRYETYKPSGIEWIGDIPEHWEVKRIKDITQFNYGDTLIGEDRIDGEVPVYGSNGITGVNDKPNTKAPCIIVGRKGSFGKINFSDIECFAIDTTFYIDSTASSQNLKWLYYALDNIGLDKLSKDTGVPGLNREDAYKERLPFPPLPEQSSIAAYLDSQTQKIDQLIANKKAQVERLKELRQIEINNAVTKGLNPHAPMKDSGIEWLGEIPGHWEVKRLKNVATKITDGEHIAPDFTESGIPFLSAKDVRENELLFEEDKFVSIKDGEKFRQRCDPARGDILIVSRGATVGRVCIVNIDRVFCLLGSVILIKPDNRILPDFLFYALTNPKIQENLFQTSQSSAQQAIYLVNIAFLTIAIPPKEEQHKISEHLKERTAAIDKLIKNTEAQIERLQELRKIKIYEAVTGKVKCHA